MGGRAEPDCGERPAAASRALRRIRTGRRAARRPARGVARGLSRASSGMAHGIRPLRAAGLARRGRGMALDARERRLGTPRDATLDEYGGLARTRNVSPYRDAAVHYPAGEFGGVLVHLFVDAVVSAHDARSESPDQ